MQMYRAHKIRLNPTPEQEQHLRQACGVARFCFNWGLAEWQRQYEEGGRPSTNALKKQFNAIKQKQFPWVYNVTKCAAETGFINLGAAFEGFFRRCKKGDKKRGYPNFKSKKRSKQAFRIDGEQIKINGQWLKIPRLNTMINMAEVLRFNAKIRSVTISEDAGHWHAAIGVKDEPPEHKHLRESVGVDLGVKTLAVLSNNVRFENKGLLRSELHKLKRLNRELARRQEGSGRWQRTKQKLERFHRHISNQRLDCQHKMTTEIAKTYRIIGMEDLNVAGMLKNHCLALSIADAGFGEIKRQMIYKAEWYRGIVALVGQFFPSSRLCPECGCINSELKLSDRTWICDCGVMHDRDLNAACNIETEALRILAGVGSQTRKMHVEQASDSSEQSATKRENRAEKVAVQTYNLDRFGKPEKKNAIAYGMRDLLTQGEIIEAEVVKVEKVAVEAEFTENK